MKKDQKVFMIDNLNAKVKQAQGVVLSDYSGLKVDQINELRREIKKAGGEFEVVKNNLFYLAGKDQWQIAKEDLQGATVALWVYENDPSILKILTNFIKKNDLPKIKLGFWDKEKILPERINQLASLPNLEKSRIRLVGFLKSPFYQLVGSLNGNLLKLAYLLQARKDQLRGGEQN